MYNNELKNIDSPEKAYLLGLFYSDGCIHSNDGSYCASVTLHEDDKYLLDIILAKFPFFRLSKCVTHAWSIVCTRKAIVEDLQAKRVNTPFYQRILRWRWQCLQTKTRKH